ncbi:MAG TPA: hypothetical protein DCQ14_00380 [Firmicutes bacterium]|nr:hypothetical protein [Bacillota bacterium]
MGVGIFVTAQLFDKIIPDRKENGQIVTTGEVSEVLVANRLHHPRPLNDIEGWAEVSGIEELLRAKPGAPKRRPSGPGVRRP